MKNDYQCLSISWQGYFEKSSCTYTLLLVGGNDEEVLNLNENALRDIKAEKKKLTIIPGATHLFEEQGKLEVVAL